VPTKSGIKSASPPELPRTQIAITHGKQRLYIQYIAYHRLAMRTFQEDRDTAASRASLNDEIMAAIAVNFQLSVT
jgi:hypothetical protein